MYPGSHALTHPDKLALIRPATGETRTYAELDARSNRLAHLFRARGLGIGDHVAIFSENNLPFVEVLAACMRAGLYVTPINRYLPPAEAAHIVNDCDARALIGSAALEHSAALARLAPRCEVRLSIGGAVDEYEDYETALAGVPPTRIADEHLGSLMGYSSGTTGRPKGIMRALPEGPPETGDPGSRLLGGLFGLDADTVYLTPAPLYHSAPAGFAMTMFQAGGTNVIMDRFEPEEALALIERHGVTHSQWVPAMFVRMLRLPDETRTRYDLSSHVRAIHAAAPCPVEVKRRMIDWWGPIIVEYYNSTESAGLALIESADWLAHPGSVGRSKGEPFLICDDAGEELPPGEPGLIYGKSPAGTRFDYHKDVGKTAATFHPRHPDWSTVGDVGYVDADGYLYLTDRKAFMIISGGVNIYPQQIEDALALHPKIGDVAVIGVPNEDLGEEVKAVVEPAPGIVPSAALADEIIAFVREKLGRQLAPRTVDFVEQLPRLPTGKLYKKGLRDLYWPSPAAPAVATKESVA